MVQFAEINQATSPYSMLQDIGRAAKPNLVPRNCLRYFGRVAKPKLVPRNCLRYLQTTLIMGGEGWSQNLCEVL